MFRFLKGFGVTLNYFWKKKVTVQYPDVKEVMPERFRGVQRLMADRCILCNLCVKACPTEVISLTGEKDEVTNKKKLTSYNIEFERCIRCEFCSEVCPTEAIVFTTKYDNLAVFDRSKMCIDQDWLEDNHIFGNYTTPEEKAKQDAIKAEAKAKAKAAAEAKAATETKPSADALNKVNTTPEQQAGAEAKVADQAVKAPGAKTQVSDQVEASSAKGGEDK